MDDEFIIIAGFVRFTGITEPQVWIYSDDIECVSSNGGGSCLQTKAGNAYFVKEPPASVLNLINESRVP